MIRKFATMNYVKGFFGRFFKYKNEEPLKKTAWISTVSGRKFYVFNPKVEDIFIEDGAHSLSLLCRFNGHTPDFYSVAQHSIYVSKMCSEENALCGLLHDLTEAYIGDMASPLKRRMDAFNEVEEVIWKQIAIKFGLPKKMPVEVKEADKRAFRMEWAYLMGGDNPDNEKFLIPRAEFNKNTPAEVEKEFMNLFLELYKKKQMAVPAV